MHFRGSNFKNFLGEHAPRTPKGLRPFKPSFTWPLVMYLHVTGEILSVTPSSKRNDNPDTWLLIGCGKKLKIMRKFLAILCGNMR